WNTSAELLNKSWNKEYAYQTLSIVDTVILPSMTGIICSVGLVGNVIVFTIIRYLALVQPFRLTSWSTRYKTIRINGLPAAAFILALPIWVDSKVIKFKDGMESCAFDLTSSDDVLRHYELSKMFPEPTAHSAKVVHVLSQCLLCSYNPSMPRQRVMKLTNRVLVLVVVFILGTAPYHVIQLVNLTEQPTLAFYVIYYLSICLSYARSSVNPFLYILLSGNFQQCLPGMQKRVIEKEIHNMENNLKWSFYQSTWTTNHLNRLV
ncbi:LOW QUALITY PROTEIN: melanin-concentrating hormone receptor 2, partial [Rhynchonycteris naso]